MHFKSLKVFCDVVGCRSFSRAADANGMTQSGASQTVHQLEERLGVKLLDRSKRPFVLTDEGRIYYEGCLEIVERMSALEEAVKSLHTQLAGRVHVTSIYSVGLSFMKQFVQDFSKRNPKTTVKLDYGHPERIYEMVRDGQTDLGLVSYPTKSKSICARVWREQPMALVVSPAHPFAERDCISIAELKGVEAVGFDENLRIRRELDKSLREHGVSWNVAMEFDNIETLKRAIEINSGVSILPAPTVERELASGTLKLIPIEDLELVRPVGVIHREGKTLGTTAQRFMEELLAVGDEALAAVAARSQDNGAEKNAVEQNAVAPAGDS